MPSIKINNFEISNEKPFTLIAEYDFDDSMIRSAVPEIASSENIKRFSM